MRFWLFFIGFWALMGFFWLGSFKVSVRPVIERLELVKLKPARPLWMFPNIDFFFKGVRWEWEKWFACFIKGSLQSNDFFEIDWNRFSICLLCLIEIYHPELNHKS